MVDNPNIMSIRELIDTAFGDPKMNVVHHKLIQTILIILARQLRMLERRVEIEIGPVAAVYASSSLSVTEVKLEANVPRRKKGKPIGGQGKGGAGGGAAGGTRGAASGTRNAGRTGPRVTSSKTGIHDSTATPPSAMSYEKSSSSATKSTTEKSSSGVTSSATKSTTDKSSSDRTRSDKTSTDKTISDLTSTDKTSSDQKRSDKTGTSKSSSDKTSPATKLTVEPSSTKPKSSAEPYSADTTEKSTEDKRSADEAADKSIGKRTSGHSLTDKSSSSAQPLRQDFNKLLETIEQQRERELRIIHQRTDSREENLKTPTPMSSMDAMEKQYEKLLIVERVPEDAVKGAGARKQTHASKTPRLSVVTQDEFNQLAAEVRQLQEKYKIAGVPDFPGNAQLMDDLRKGASLTDAMAALQLSARLEAAERALEKMLSLVTDLASKTPGIDVEDGTTATAGAPSQKSDKSRKSIPAKAPSSKRISSVAPKSVSKESSEESIEVLKQPSETKVEEQDATAPEKSKEPPDAVSHEELNNALQEVYDECLKMVTTATNRSNVYANNALKIAQKLEGQLDESLNLGDRMFNLEKIISDYAEQINILDTGLSSQMTNYQEQLTQMQHDLEAGLEAMAEALANTGGDTAAVAELNNHFTNLQTDIDIATMRQKELGEMQNALSLDLQGLWKQIEILRDIKSDRDEVEDALRDKAGLGALNGLVSRQEFDAVRGDFEKRIGQAYDKFNNQEVVWQRAIDDLLRELNDKADWLQVTTLQESINQYLNKFRDKIRAIEEIVGEPRAATVSRKLLRDTDCLSCATPANLEEETGRPPLLAAFPSSRPPAVGAEADDKPKEDGDHAALCYPGLPIPHPMDRRAHVCHRYCGGSHTLVSNTLSRAPAGMIINPALRQVATAEGTDGKLYMVDDLKKPCIPCNYKKDTTPEPSKAEPALSHQDDSVTVTTSLLDIRQTSMKVSDETLDMVYGTPDMVDATPPQINSEFED